MNTRYIIVASLCVLLGACVTEPVFKGDDYAFIRSNYPIVSINGEATEPVYSLDLVSGDITLIVVYKTYRNNYYCTFRFAALEHNAYEITNQENKYPLTLFRWVRTNSLWASRLDHVDPVECAKQAV